MDRITVEVCSREAALSHLFLSCCFRALLVA
jgi:hypothetical protein